jgi:hypothetical protein
MARNREIEIVGLKELLAKLEPSKLVEQPAQQAMEKVGQRLVQAVRSGAPQGESGQTRGKAFYKLSSRPGKWLVVGTKATAKGKRGRAYPYPRRLEFDPKSRHKDWLLHLTKGQARGIEQELKTAIERGFGG